MGWILSKFRKSKSTMEVLTKLESEINGIIEFKANTAQTQKRVVGHLVTYSIVIYLLVAIFAYFKLFPAARTAKDQFLLLLPFLISPFLVLGLRRFLTWYYHRKIVSNEKKLEELKKKKLKILDEVMETETYKVAKEILDKFGDKNQGSRPLPGLSAVFNKQGSVDSQLRKRNVGDPQGQGRPNLNQSLPVTSASKPGVGVKPAGAGPPSKLNTSMSSVTQRPGPHPGSAQSTPGMPGQPGTRQLPSMGPGGGGRPGPPLPRPILPRERGYLDKFVEFLVGDGPANRYALICRQCESHNGMALREEFEYIAYRCCYCYYWNPARKQRPVAPRLTAAAEKPVPNSNSSESSGSDVSAPPSVPSSRRESISNPKSEEKVSDDDIKRENPVKDEVVDNSEDREADIQKETKVKSVVNDKGDVAVDGENDPTIETKSKDTIENEMDVDS